MLSCVVLQKLVVKPDQLIKRRGKLGLIKVNTDINDAKEWIQERIGKETKVNIDPVTATSKLNQCWQ